MGYELMNKLTVILGALFGMIFFIVQVFPTLQEGINQIGIVLIMIVPVEYQGIVKLILVAIGVLVAVIIYAYDFITSKKYAEEQYLQGLMEPVPKTVMDEPEQKIE